MTDLKPPLIDMNSIDWSPTGLTPEKEGELVATHIGVLDLGFWRFRCHQLSDGRRVIDANDIAAFFADGESE